VQVVVLDRRRDPEPCELVCRGGDLIARRKQSFASPIGRGAIVWSDE
jgi:hypothetical protein